MIMELDCEFARIASRIASHVTTAATIATKIVLPQCVFTVFALEAHGPIKNTYTSRRRRMSNNKYISSCLINDNKPVDIHLVLTYHWYDEIDAGRKWVEYREHSDYYKRMFLRNYKLLKQRYGSQNTPMLYLYKNIRSVIFHRGYTRKTMRWRVANIRVAFGRPQWGAPYHPVFCIYLAERYR